MGRLASDANAYATDAAQRGMLMLDILRERADLDAKHEAPNTPPVLIYKYEAILDGKTLSPPCNKVLLRILPPEGVKFDEKKRSYMIVDPRAGHGAGIGGFKPDGQVGVALHNGHPAFGGCQIKTCWARLFGRSSISTRSHPVKVAVRAA